ncbi:neutral zinc metallopeptidase [Nocardia transvalensis]|nr:neutral zinc metallopeptidase [Nocardia transvalensis]
MGGRDNHPSRDSYATPSHTYAPPTWTTSAPAPTTTARATPSRTGYATPTTTRPAGPQPVAATAGNPLFRDPDSGLINISCTYPRWASDVASARAFFEAARTCLDNMWKPVLQAAKLPFSTPNLSVTARAAEASSPCGSGQGNWAAFYCSANHMIYMPLDQLFINEDRSDAAIFLAVFAHEYGHHVQSISGIMGKNHRDRYDAGPTSARGLELSRRGELEAQCFGGMFIGSSTFVGTLTGAQTQRTIRDNYGRGDKAGDARDHGSLHNYGAWYEHGVEHNRTQKCNTWSSPADSVS